MFVLIYIGLLVLIFYGLVLFNCYLITLILNTKCTTICPRAYSSTLRLANLIVIM
ncbi:hypothetical protein C0J52_02145 [Blattella germanica]|nr:hypothetical protein C0J52_02145 [Blattella germanica]